MRFDEERWVMLEESLRSDNVLTDVMFRRTVGYVEEAIYKPTITEQIVMAWSEYIQFYLMEYKVKITIVCVPKSLSHQHQMKNIFY